MHYYLCIKLSRFYVEFYRPHVRPLIVSREKTVLDVNRAAENDGVAPGMTVRQAKMLSDGCAVREWRSEKHSDRQAVWLDICAEYSGIIEPIDQHMAVLDLSGHPDPLDVTGRIVMAVSARTRLPVYYGAGCAKWISRLAVGHEMAELPVKAPKAFLAPLPVSELVPVEEEHRQRLAFLGYGTIGEVATIPLDVLQKQFGQDGIRISAAAQGRLSQPVHAVYPKGSIREHLIFEGPVSVWETIDHGLEALADRLGERLEDRKLQGSIVELKIETSHAQPILKKRRFTKPIRNAPSALIALHLLSQDRPSAPVTALKVELRDLEPVRHRQLRLNGLETIRDRPDARAAVSYVRTVFGDGSVKLASEVEVPRRVRVLREWQSATGWR